MISGFVSKIFSESILAFIPSFIKSVNISFYDKFFLRFLIFVIISFFLSDFTVIREYLFSKNGLFLSFVTIIHVFSSYNGYELLNGGVANSILYMYPLFILFLSDFKFRWIYIIFLIGLALLAYSNLQENFKPIFIDKDKEEKFEFQGVLYMIVAAITEALIYFQVIKIKTKNNWNHIFISYFFGLLLLFLFRYQKSEMKMDGTVIVTSLFYIFILLVGYYLRFYAMNHLHINYYSILSYLGILFTYLYGFIFLKEKMNIYNISGTLCILFGNFILLKE